MQSIISALILKSKIKINSGLRVAQLKRDCAAIKLYASSLELELIELRLERLDWNDKLVVQEERRESLLKEVEILRNGYEERINVLLEENNKLVKALSKIKGIRTV